MLHNTAMILVNKTLPANYLSLLDFHSYPSYRRHIVTRKRTFHGFCRGKWSAVWNFGENCRLGGEEPTLSNSGSYLCLFNLIFLFCCNFGVEKVELLQEFLNRTVFLSIAVWVCFIDTWRFEEGTQHITVITPTNELANNPLSPMNTLHDTSIDSLIE